MEMVSWGIAQVQNLTRVNYEKKGKGRKGYWRGVLRGRGMLGYAGVCWVGSNAGNVRFRFEIPNFLGYIIV